MEMRNFVYLDSDTLRGYISTLEQGLQDGRQQSVGKDGSGETGVDAKIIKAQAKLGRSTNTSTNYTDTDEARFDRWLDAAIELEIVEVVLDPATLADATSGLMYKLDCEIEVPQFALFTGGAEAKSQLEGIAAVSKMFGDEQNGMGAELQKMLTFVDAMSTDSLPIRGELDDSDWGIFSNLKKKHLNGSPNDLEGFVTVVGKVRKSVPDGQSKMLMTLPGVTAMNRKQRKELDAKPRDPGSDDLYIDGPAIQLEVLAIYS